MNITDEQKREIEMLANNGHDEALIAYGGDMYHQGIIIGTIIFGAGMLLGATCYGGYKLIRLMIDNRKTKKRIRPVNG